MAAPSERTKAQRDNVFLFMRADISHISLHNTTLFLCVLIFKHSSQRLSFYATRFVAAVSMLYRAEQLKAEIAQSGMLIRATAQRPMIFTFGFLNRKIVDTRQP